MKIARNSYRRHRILLTVVAGGLALLVSVRITDAQQLPAGVRERAKKATGQVAMGKKVTGEDKIEVVGWGSGWFVNGTGLMVTNDHVVNPSHYSPDPTTAFRVRNDMGIIQYRVTLNGGTNDEKTYTAELMYQNESADLALLQVRDEDGGPLDTPAFISLVPSIEIVAGQRVTVLGYPKGPQMATSKEKHAPVTVSGGNVTAIDVAPSGRIKKFKVDAQAAPGNSGGPAINKEGKLIGVLVEGGADVSVSTGVAGGLIPADVVADMMRAALGLNKIETDLAPFLGLLVNRDLEVFVPGRERLSGKDIIEFKDGETMTGEITDEHLQWKTRFGDVNVPVARAGYIVNDNGVARLLLEGGEQFSADAEEVTISFTNARGRQVKLNMSNLRSVLFRKPNGRIPLPDRHTLVLEGDGCHFFLSDVEGKIKFKEETKGLVLLSLDEIRRVETRHYKQHIHKIDGSQLHGKFEPHTLTATLASMNSPLSFSLHESRRASIGSTNPAKQYDRDVALAVRLQIDKVGLVKIADALDEGDSKKAGALLDELMVPAALKAKAKPLQQQIKVLYAEHLLRAGDYEDAAQMFKSARKASIRGVKTYAESRYELLKVYPVGKYLGQDLSDPAVFDTAAVAMAEQIVEEAQEIMIAHRKAQITEFSGWKKLNQKCQRLEADLRLAAGLGLSRAERTRFQMWRFRQNRNWATLKMLRDEQMRLGTEIEEKRANRKPLRNLARKLDRVNKNMSTVLIKYRSLRGEMNPLGDGPGYRVDDPDAREFLN